MDDWQVGDKAVCVDDSPSRHGRKYQRQLEAGRIYTVTSVWAYAGQPDAHILVDGEQPRIPPGYKYPAGWGSTRFRKIRPDAHEPCEAEFVTLLRRTKERA